MSQTVACCNDEPALHSICSPPGLRPGPAGGQPLRSVRIWPANPAGKRPAGGARRDQVHGARAELPGAGIGCGAAVRG